MYVCPFKGRLKMWYAIIVTTPHGWVGTIWHSFVLLLPFPTGTEVKVNFKKLHELKHLSDRAFHPESNDANSRFYYKEIKKLWAY